MLAYALDQLRIDILRQVPYGRILAAEVGCAYIAACVRLGCFLVRPDFRPGTNPGG